MLENRVLDSQHPTNLDQLSINFFPSWNRHFIGKNKINPVLNLFTLFSWNCRCIKFKDSSFYSKRKKIFSLFKLWVVFENFFIITRFKSKCVFDTKVSINNWRLNWLKIWISDWFNVFNNGFVDLVWNVGASVIWVFFNLVNGFVSCKVEIQFVVPSDWVKHPEVVSGTFVG